MVGLGEKLKMPKPWENDLTRTLQLFLAKRGSKKRANIGEIGPF